MCAFRENDIDRKSKVVAGRWYLEQQTVGVGRGLANFQVTGPQFIRSS
jgi:hypothetical protein